jgi:hypothetical protein
MQKDLAARNNSAGIEQRRRDSEVKKEIKKHSK